MRDISKYILEKHSGDPYHIGGGVYAVNPHSNKTPGKVDNRADQAKEMLRRVNERFERRSSQNVQARPIKKEKKPSLPKETYLGLASMGLGALGGMKYIKNEEIAPTLGSLVGGLGFVGANKVYNKYKESKK